MYFGDISVREYRVLGCVSFVLAHFNCLQSDVSMYYVVQLFRMNQLVNNNHKRAEYVYSHGLNCLCVALNECWMQLCSR